MRMVRNGVVVDFGYVNGIPATISFNGNTFYYVTKGQGDVTGITDSQRNVLITYYYDAWGSPYCTYNTATSPYAQSLYNLNPLLYRGYVFDRELGMYYLESRYYIPEIGRFLNADNYLSGFGGDLKRNSLFAYCFNNPVNMIDEGGDWGEWIKSTVKWVAKNVVKPVVKGAQELLSHVDITYSAGINASGSLGFWTGNVQGGISVDSKGNVALQTMVGGGITTGPVGTAITGYGSWTNSPSIDKLEGPYAQLGGSIAAPTAVGGDIMFISDAELNTTYLGLTGNFGVGASCAEFHVEWGETNTNSIIRFNVYDILGDAYHKIMGW